MENAEYIVHARKGIIETINGDFAQINLLSVIPLLNEQQSFRKALDFVHSKVYKWEDVNCEKSIKESTNNPKATYFPTGELVILKDFNIGKRDCRLAWKFTISSLVPYNEQWIYVDANTGGILANTPLILDSNYPGVAETRYSGNKNIMNDSYIENGTTKYRLNETRNTTPSHSINIHTWNLQSQSNPNNKIEFRNTNTNFTTGSWPAITVDQAALDAHWGAEMVSDYWSSVRHRNSLNNQGLGLTNYLHFWENGYGFPNNSGWDLNNHLVVYGDGDGNNFHPYTALDIVGHEMGHGINQYTANLYSPGYNQECDALSEGFSDIWGATIKHWAVPTKHTWLHGDEIIANPIYNCERDLTNPNSTLTSEGPHPDTWHGDFWSASGEPHFNSTVLSHWYYLVSTGGTGWNNGHTSHAQANQGQFWSVTPIGIDVAARIAYIAESHYLTSSANYNSVRLMTIQAAIDSFGFFSQQAVSVTNAWNAVGVGGAYSYPIEGASVICNQESYVINKLPTGATVTWLDPSPNLTRISSQGSNPCVFQKVSKGNGQISALINCGNTTLTRQVHTGTYDDSDYPITGPSSSPCNQYIYFAIPELQGVTLINWTWPSNWTYVSGQGTPYLALKTGKYSGGVAVGVDNVCG